VSSPGRINRHGADAFRWYYFASQQPWAGYRFSVDTVGDAVRHFLLTLWNTYSFFVLYANAEGLEPEPLGGVWSSGKRGEGPSGELDRWALSRLQRTIAEVREQMDTFDCTTAAGVIADYSEELSNWYLRLSRRRFWDGDETAFATLRHCLTTLATLLAPFTPFLADEIYTNLAAGSDEDGFGDRPDSVHLCDYPEVDEDLIDPQLEAGMEAVRRTVELGRAARAQAKVKLRQPLRKAVVVASDAERTAIERLAEVVASELNVKELDFVQSEAELVSYRAKPNYRSLGPRFGKNMPQVAAAVEALDAAAVADALERGEEVGIQVEGKDHTLAADDLSLVMEPLDGYQVEAESGTRSPWSSTSTTSSAARDSPARSFVPSRRPGSRPASRSPIALHSRSAVTRSCSQPPASTRPTSRGRPWRPRSTTARTAPARRRPSRAASCESRSARPECPPRWSSTWTASSSTRSPSGTTSASASSRKRAATGTTAPSGT
jgi:isoleucyl-tRNA synthetase